MSTIAELAQWPNTETDVTVTNMTRALLVWAKIYECRLIYAVEQHDDPALGTLAAASIGMATAGQLLEALAAFSPTEALRFARQQWQIGDDGEVGADALLEALDRIDPDLAEAIVVAYETTVEAETSA